MWLLLPRGNQPGRLLGAVFGIASLVLFAIARRDDGWRLASEVAFVAAWPR